MRKVVLTLVHTTSIHQIHPELRLRAKRDIETYIRKEAAADPAVAAARHRAQREELRSADGRHEVRKGGGAGRGHGCVVIWMDSVAGML